MFSIVHVLLPMSDQAPAEAIRTSLAPFERGGRGDLPEERLTFHDEAEHVRALHRAEFVFTREAGGGLRIEGGDVSYLDTRAVEAEMADRGLKRWAAVCRCGCALRRFGIAATGGLESTSRLSIRHDQTGLSSDAR